jgi:CoA:oxalate CoA-transferase
VPCGPINTVADVVVDPQVTARRMIVEVDDPNGPMRVAGNPVKLSGYDDPPTRGPVPDLDAHRAALLAELGLATEPAIERAVEPAVEQATDARPDAAGQ